MSTTSSEPSDARGAMPADAEPGALDLMDIQAAEISSGR
jgi:hypothetical protein